MKFLLPLLFALNSYGADLNLQGVSLVDESQGYSVKLGFSTPVPEFQPNVEFINETIQVDIPNATVQGGRILKRVSAGKIKSLYAYQLDESTARFRLILSKGVKADQFKDSVRISANGNGLGLFIQKAKATPKVETADSDESIQVNVKPSELTAPEAATAVTAPTGSIEAASSMDDSAIESELKDLAKSAAKKKEQSSTTAKTEQKVEKKADKVGEQKESEIPVFQSSKEKKATTSTSSPFRMILGLFVVAMALGGLWWATTKWVRKKKLVNPHTNIRVITQHYLGPKKSLAIISVAGESLLVGITDHNITMLKSLSLLEEEMPQGVTSNFAESLKVAESDTAAAEGIEDYAMKGVKDIVSDRLKGMRNLW